MFKRIGYCFLVGLLIMAISPAWGAVPRKLSFQGKITPPPATTPTITFDLTATGSSLLNLPAVDLTYVPATGVYSCYVDLTDKVYFLGQADVKVTIKVNGSPAVTNQPLVSAPYALRAAYADELSAGDKYISGKLGVGAYPDSPLAVGAKLTVLANENNPTALAIGFNDTGSDTPANLAMAINPGRDGSWTTYDYSGNKWNPGLFQKGGKVGVGVTEPGARLDVNDNDNVGIKGTSWYKYGVYGASTNNAGVFGSSNIGNGVIGFSASGYGGSFNADGAKAALYAQGSTAAHLVGNVKVEGTIYASDLQATNIGSANGIVAGHSDSRVKIKKLLIEDVDRVYDSVNVDLGISPGPITVYFIKVHSIDKYGEYSDKARPDPVYKFDYANNSLVLKSPVIGLRYTAIIIYSTP